MRGRKINDPHDYRRSIMKVSINCIDSASDKVMLEIFRITKVCAGTIMMINMIMMIMMTRLDDHEQ